uniref:Folliculin n=1 Tax=Strigamia maritima TaxID=126957 RepID=T1JEG0_STRMM
MNAVIALCHFCEFHGPTVLFCTQTFHESDDPEKVFDDKKNKFRATRKFFMVDQKNTCLHLHHLSNPIKKMRAMMSKLQNIQQTSCQKYACQSFSPGQPDYISNDHEAKVSYISSQYPHHPDVFSVVRQACVRSLSCEVCPGREGPIFFGDEHRSHVFSHTFFLKDSQARGFQRWYSIVMVMMDKVFLLNSWPFLVKQIRNFIDQLQAKANKVYFSEQTDCPQRALRLKSSFTMTPANFRRQRSNISVRGLYELTNDKQVFYTAHVWFTWILKACGNRLTEKLLEGPPTEDTVIDLEKQEETEEGFMLVRTKKIPKEYSRLNESDHSEEKNESRQRSSITIRQLFQVLGKNLFHDLAYHVVMGNQIVIRCSKTSVAVAIIDCLKVLLPKGCFRPVWHSEDYQDSWKCNFLSIPPNVELPPHIQSSPLHLLIDVILPLNNQISDYKFVMNSIAEFPEKSPFLLTRFESAIQDVNLSDKVLDCLFTSLKEEWMNKVKVLFKFSRTTSRNVEETNQLLHVLGAQEHDKQLLKFWMTGLSSQFKTHVLSATMSQCHGNEGMARAETVEIRSDFNSILIMESTIEELGKKLIAAVEIAMNETATREQRLRANGFWENFKETSPHCVECGLYLSTINNSPIVRHMGLQLIEHCIKNRWNNLNFVEKQFIRDNALRLLVSGTNDMLTEPAFIKNAVTKIVVEIIKRQWPLEWPTLIDDLRDVSNVGDTQTEMVLLIYLRLFEDTMTLQNISSSHRRQVLNQALNTKLSYIIYFSIQLLLKHAKKFKFLSTKDPFNLQQISIHCQMTKTVLETFTYFAEWIPFVHLWSNLRILPQICSLLKSEKLRLQAVECLLKIVSRKGHIEDRKPHLTLFTEHCMKHIYQAAITPPSVPVDEHRYTFLKRLGEVLIGIGNQLTVLWGSGDIGRPENFEMYLNAIFAFTSHPSQMLNQLTQILWLLFMRHEHICQDSILLSFVTRIARVLRLKLMKVGSPSRDDHPSCQYSIYDFDNVEDFNVFFSKYRVHNTDILRLATVLCPLKTFNLAATWLQQLAEPGNSSTVDEWEAIALYLASICSNVIHTDKPKPSAEQGNLLLQSVLRHETNDPDILYYTLSCIFALFNFLTLSNEALPAVLDKMFSAMTFSLPGQTKSNRSVAVNNVRHHACAGLVKLCTKHPILLIPSFEQIHQRVDVLSDDPNQLSMKERYFLYEALIFVTNQFNNYQQQANFFEKYLNPVKKIWLSQEITDALSTAETLMHYVGLTRSSGDKDEDTFESNRSRIFCCISTVMGVVKSTKWPEDSDSAIRGGYLRPYATSGCSDVVLCNPATPFVLPFLDNLFKLIRSLNNLWLPETKALLASEYLQAYDTAYESKLNVSSMSPLERMQDFICSVHDYWYYYILGNSSSNLMHEFFVFPGLGQHVISDVMCNIDLIPDHKLRSIFRNFLKSFVRYCPSDCYETTVVPVLIQLCPYMFQRLNNKWMQPSDETKYENENSEELFEDQLLFQYYLFLASILRCATNDSTMESDVIAKGDNQNTSELGQLALKHDVLGPSIVFCCFHALSWKHSQICIKMIHLCSIVFKYLLASGTLSGETAKDLLMCILLGLHVHGQHPFNEIRLLHLAFQVYESLRPLHPEVSSLLREIPDCPVKVLQWFDNTLLNETEKRQPEKKRKETFKLIVDSIIGKNIGELFSKPIESPRPLIENIISKPNTMALCEVFSSSTKLFKRKIDDTM